MGDMLTLNQAQTLLTAATEHAAGLGVPMSFAVMDPAGHLVALARMDGALWITPEVAQGKAWTAAAYGTPSRAQKDKMEALPNFATALTQITQGHFTPQTGAVPVYADGVLLGAIGGSGGTGDQDEAACAAAVLAAGFTTSA
jgi:uncharacterized protein GlcG (DUF336 family)